MECTVMHQQLNWVLNINVPVLEETALGLQGAHCCKERHFNAGGEAVHLFQKMEVYLPVGGFDTIHMLTISPFPHGTQYTGNKRRHLLTWGATLSVQHTDQKICIQLPRRSHHITFKLFFEHFKFPVKIISHFRE